MGDFDTKLESPSFIMLLIGPDDCVEGGCPGSVDDARKKLTSKRVIQRWDANLCVCCNADNGGE